MVFKLQNSQLSSKDILQIVNKMDQISFNCFRRCSQFSHSFVQAQSKQIKVQLFSALQLVLTNNYVEIFRIKKFKMDDWEQDENIKTQLIGISPKVITLRPPMGAKVIEFIKYYRLEHHPIFIYDLETEGIAPVLKSVTPQNIRICYGSLNYDEKIFGLDTIKNAGHVRCDYFLGLPPTVHPLVAERIHEIRIGFTETPPIRFIRTILMNYWEDKSVIKIVDVQTHLQTSPKATINRILANFPSEHVIRISAEGLRSTIDQFLEFNVDFNEKSSIRLLKKGYSEFGLLFVSRSKIVFATTNDNSGCSLLIQR